LSFSEPGEESRRIAGTLRIIPELEILAECVAQVIQRTAAGL